MKCLALRMGEEYRDIDDVKILLAALGIRSPVEAEQILSRYYPVDRYPAKARYVLEELLGPGPT